MAPPGWYPTERAATLTWQRRVEGRVAGTVTVWEYLIVELPPFKSAAAARGESDSVAMLNREGGDGWEGSA
jgi:hypothetical protein